MAWLEDHTLMGRVLLNASLPMESKETDMVVAIVVAGWTETWTAISTLGSRKGVD